jgi:hypothetical protein
VAVVNHEERAAHTLLESPLLQRERASVDLISERRSERVRCVNAQIIRVDRLVWTGDFPLSYDDCIFLSGNDLRI